MGLVAVFFLVGINYILSISIQTFLWHLWQPNLICRSRWFKKLFCSFFCFISKHDFYVSTMLFQIKLIAIVNLIFNVSDFLRSFTGWKLPLWKMTYSLNGPVINLLFYCHIVLYWEKVTSYDKFSHRLILEDQIGEFHYLNLLMKVSKCWKKMNFQEFQLTWKIWKHYTKPTASQHKSLLRLWNKSLYRKIHRNTQTFAFQELRECNS